MFGNWSNQLAAGVGNDADAKKSMSPSLRTDIYSAIDKAKQWIIGGGGGGAGLAGDGVSYGAILSTIQKHFPNAKMGIESIGHAEGEVAIIVEGVTNMIMEYSKWESMSGAMAMGTWLDGVVEAHRRATLGNSRKDSIARGIARGINQNCDVSLMTKDFAARIQMISSLKTVNSRIYGTGSEEARRGEALLSSRFMQ